MASMAVSPNGSFLAVACLDGKLRVMSSGKHALLGILRPRITRIQPHPGGASRPLLNFVCYCMQEGSCAG